MGTFAERYKLKRVTAWLLMVLMVLQPVISLAALDDNSPEGSNGELEELGSLRDPTIPVLLDFDGQWPEGAQPEVTIHSWNWREDLGEYEEEDLELPLEEKDSLLKEEKTSTEPTVSLLPGVKRYVAQGEIPQAADRITLRYSTEDGVERSFEWPLGEREKQKAIERGEGLSLKLPTGYYAMGEAKGILQSGRKEVEFFVGDEKRVLLFDQERREGELLLRWKEKTPQGGFDLRLENLLEQEQAKVLSSTPRKKPTALGSPSPEDVEIKISLENLDECMNAVSFYEKGKAPKDGSSDETSLDEDHGLFTFHCLPLHPYEAKGSLDEVKKDPLSEKGEEEKESRPQREVTDPLKKETREETISQDQTKGEISSGKRTLGPSLKKNEAKEGLPLPISPDNNPLAGPEIFSLRMLRAPMERAAGDSWTPGEPKKFKSPNAELEVTSVTENADGTLSWTVEFSPHAITNNNKLYHRFEDTTPEVVESVSGMDLSLDKTYFRSTGTASNQSGTTYTIVTKKPTGETASLKGRFYIIQRGGAEPAVQYRASVEFEASATAPIKNGSLQVIVSNEDKADLTGAKLHLTGPENKDISLDTSPQTISLKEGTYELSHSGIPAGNSVTYPEKITITVENESTLAVKVTKDMGTVNLKVEGDKPSSYRVKANGKEIQPGANGLPVGEYNFTAEGFDAALYKATITPENATLSKDGTIDVTVHFKKLVPTFNYTVHASYPPGEREPQDLKAKLTDPSGKIYEAPFRDGVANFSQVPEGIYTLSFEGVPLTWETPESQKVTVNETNTQQRVAFEKKTVDSQNILLTGKVQTKDGIPIQEEAIFILKDSNGNSVKENGQELTLTTGPDGTIYKEISRNTLPNGEFTLWLKQVPKGYRDPKKATNTLTINSKDQFYDFTTVLETAGIQFDLTVTDSKKKPIEQATFKIRQKGKESFVQQNGADVELKTNAQGLATLSLEGLPEGGYELVHQGTKGFKTYPPIPFTVTSATTTVKTEVALQRNEESRVEWDVYLKDEAGNPIAGKVLKFFNDDGSPVLSNGKPLEITTNNSGETRGGAFIDIYPGTYTVKFEGDASYSPVEKTVTIPDGAGRIETQLTTSLLGQQGTITIQVVNEQNGKPVGGAPYQIYQIDREGGSTTRTLVDQGLTDSTGFGRSKNLPYGDYEVELIETGNIFRPDKNDETNSNPRSVTLSPEHRQTTETFKVTTKLINIMTAGSFNIEGVWTGNPEDESSAGDVHWSVTATKNASSPSSFKRGVQVEFKIPTAEMGQPQLPKVTKISKDSTGKTVLETVPATGSWKKSGEYWVYSEDRVNEKSVDETVYKYDFKAPALKDAPRYSLTGTMNIVSENPLEIIPPAMGTKILDEKKDFGTVSFQGVGTTDNQVDKVSWTIQDPSLFYTQDEPGPTTVTPELKANENFVPGQFTYELRLPEKSGLEPFTGNEVVKATFYEPYDPKDPGNQELKELNLSEKDVTIRFDKEKKAWVVTLNRETTGRFRPKFEVTNAIDRKQNVEKYRINLDTSFESKGTKQSFQTLSFDAYPIPQLPGERVEVISSCGNDDYRHAINLYGEMSEDKQKIVWTARVTNLSAAPYELYTRSIAPFTAQITAGEGLGNPKILQVNSIGKTYPYITSGPNKVFEGQETEREFLLHADYASKHFAHNWTSYRSTPGYNYVSGTDKIDINGERYKWSDIFLLLAKYSGPRYQRLAAGEYMTVTFETPITDFSRISTGYTINVLSNRYDYSHEQSTDSKKPLCQADASLTLKAKPHNLESSEVVIRNNDIGEIRGNGKYIHAGQDIEWSIDVKPLLKNVADIGATRNMKVIYQLVDDDDKSGEVYTGLGTIANRQETKISSGSLQVTSQNSGDGGTIQLSKMRANESYNLTFTTPVLAEKPHYRLKILGFYNGDTPLKNSEDETHIAYVTLPGKSVKIRSLLRWEKLYDNEEKPETTLQLTRVGIDGKREIVATKTVHTPLNKNEILVEFDKDDQGNILKRFDDNGYLYEYYISEPPLPNYSIQIDRLSADGENWLVKNIKEDVVLEEKDPFKYTLDEKGKYPDPYFQDGADLRNADARNMNQLNGPGKPGEPYKAEYSDSIVGKWGEQTSVPGQFNINLTIEGKGKYGSGDIDVVFVLDNSNSMRYTWTVREINSYYKNSKMKSLNETVVSLIEELEKRDGNTRVGVVNFATVVEPLTDGNSPPQSQRPYYQYPEKYEIGLTDLKTQRSELDKAIPGEFAARYNKHIDYFENDGQTNTGTKYDGMTNIADGIRRGAELLYPEGESETGRKKMLVVISDGAPVAHLKLKHFPLKTDLSLKENLALAGGKQTSGAEYGPYVLNNNKFKLYGHAKYRTEEGIEVSDHLLPTVAISNYYQDLHPTMEVYSVGIESETNGFASSGRTGDHFDASDASRWQEQVLRGITSDPEKNYFKAENDEELKDYLKEFQSFLPEASIIDGVVEDPMGDQIILDVSHDFKVASSPLLEDGDFYLSDNYHNYLGQDGYIHNNNPNNTQVTATVVQYSRDMYSYPVKETEKFTVALDTNGQPLQYYDPKTQALTENAISKPQSEGGAYGAYTYLLAINKRKDSGIGRENLHESKLAYLQNPSGFQVIQSLDEALTAIKYNAGDLILIKNNHRGKFTSLQGLGEYPKIDAKDLQVGKNLLGTPENGRIPRVKVERVGNKLRITGLHLSSGEEVKLKYRIHLKTEDANFTPDYYYQANKTTTLDPRPHTHPGRLRYFPIPSVKGPNLPLEAKKEWLNSNKEPMSEKEISDILLREGLLGVEFSILQYKAIVKANGEANFDNLTKDEKTLKVLGTLTLDSTNQWKETIQNLPAYDNQGRPFLYELHEMNVPSGFEFEKKETYPKYLYDIESGFRLDGGQKVELTATNTKTDEPQGQFKIIKKDAKDGKTLSGAQFALSNDQGFNRTIILDNKGIGTFLNLKPGEYTLKEKKAPPGYELDPREYRVKVTEPIRTVIRPSDNKAIELYTIKIFDHTDNEIQAIENSSNDLFPMYEITNKTMTLPKTGGLGFTWSAVFLGLALLGACAYVYKVNLGGDAYD